MKSIFFIVLVGLLAGGCSDSGVKAQVEQIKQHQIRQEQAAAGSKNGDGHVQLMYRDPAVATTAMAGISVEHGIHGK